MTLCNLPIAIVRHLQYPLKNILHGALLNFELSYVNFGSFSMHKMLSKLQAVVYFTCADDGIGPFDRSTASQQSLMELFIFGVNEPEKICGSREDPDDVCEWAGVECNADGEVEEFHWVFQQEAGTDTLGFEFLPWSMKIVVMWNNALSGTIQLADLPGKTEGVYLSVNQLTGSLELDGLPATVRELDLSENEFIEEIFLGNLPKGLKSLALSDNRLSGTICLISGPPALEYLHLQKKQL